MSDDKSIYVVYDDDCPFCRNYCKLVSIREAVGNLELVDARKPSALMDEITAQGLDIDQGMVVKIGNEIHYGSNAIHMLALLSSKSITFNRFTYWLFKSHKTSSILYPFLKSCRNLVLWLLCIPRIRNLEKV